MKEEIWKPVPDVITGVKTSDRYLVSNLGRVKSLPYIKHGRNRSGGFSYLSKGLICKLSTNQDGYKIFHVKRDGVSNSMSVHRLVAFAFLDKPTQDSLQVNHKDGVKDNNNVDNLEWVTPRENVVHSYANNLASNKCERHPRSILSNEQVQSMRELYEGGGYSYQDLSDLYEIKYHTVWKIVNGINYGSLL